MENGEYEFTYKAVPEHGEIMHDNGNILRLEDNKSQSRKLRGQLTFIAEEAHKDAKEFYDATMIDIRHFLPDLLVYIEQFKNQGL